MKRRGPVPDVVVRFFDEAWQRWQFTGGVPRHLEADSAAGEGPVRVILGVPARQVIDTQVQEQLIVELYSK